MDTITHALVGATISDGWFRRRLGPLATPFALAVSSLPDLDMVTFLVSPEYAWAHHRGYTHSLLPMLAAAPVLGYAGYRLAKKEGGWLLWTLLALCCLYAHTLFDLITSWGTMPLLPFSRARVSWDVAPIIDVFLFSLPAASFVANRVLRWEKVDTFINPLRYPVVHRHPRRQRAGTLIARLACALVACYLLIGWFQGRQTVRVARQTLAGMGVSPVEIRAMPVMFTHIAWHVAARDAEGAVYTAPYSSYATKPMAFTKHPTLPRDAFTTVLSAPEGGMFTWYSQNMYTAEREWLETGSIVVLRDRRFALLSDAGRSQFAMEFTRDPEGRVVGSRILRMEGKEFDIRQELDLLWALMWTGKPELPPTDDYGGR